MEARGWITSLLVVGALEACETPPPPGELVGRYQVTGKMESDSCGPGLGANRSIAFNAELRDDEGTGYWVLADRRPTPGSLDDTGEFFFQQESGWTLVEPQAQSGYNGCRIAQLETIDGRIEHDSSSDAGVDSGPEGIGLAGTNTIEVSPLAGDDCSPGLASQGGPFLALPCRIQYTLTGVPIADE